MHNLRSLENRDTMIKADIAKEHLIRAEELRFTHPNEIVQRRMSVIYFKGLGRSNGEISLLAGVSSTTVTTVLKLYKKGGLEAVTAISRRRPKSLLELHSETILNHFEKHPPSTAKEAKKVIESLTGITRNVSRIKVFLHKIGLKPRKTAALPAKVDPEAQECFKKKIWGLAF